MQKLPDGEPFYIAGEYRVVDPPARLEFSWTWEDPAEKVRDSVVKVLSHEAHRRQNAPVKTSRETESPGSRKRHFS